MRQYLFLPSLLLPAVLLYMPTSGVTEMDKANISQPYPRHEERSVQLLSLGLEESIVSVKIEAPFVRFLNSSASPDVAIAFDESTVTAECPDSTASSRPTSTFYNKTPIKPGETVRVCFQNPGTYNYTVYGLPSAPGALRGSIVVE